MLDEEIFNQYKQQIIQLLDKVLHSTENELLVDFDKSYGTETANSLDKKSYWTGANELRNDAMLNLRKHFDLLLEKSPDSIN